MSLQYISIKTLVKSYKIDTYNNIYNLNTKNVFQYKIHYYARPFLL